MSVFVTDTLTNKQWVMPNTPGPIYMGQFPPGTYDITNGGTVPVAISMGTLIVMNVPVGVTWNLSTNENIRSWENYCLDYAIWQHSGRFN